MENNSKPMEEFIKRLNINNIKNNGNLKDLIINHRGVEVIIQPSKIKSIVNYKESTRALLITDSYTLLIAPDKIKITLN